MTDRTNDTHLSSGTDTLTTSTEYTINLMDANGVPVERVTIPRAIYDNHFSRSPNDMPKSTYSALMRYINGDCKPLFSPRLAALLPVDRVRGSFAFRRSITNSTEESIALGRIISSSIREDVSDLLSKLNLSFSSEDSISVILGEYFCTKNFNIFEVDWERVICLLFRVCKEDSILASTFYTTGWTWNTTVNYSVRPCPSGMVFDYDTDASFQLIGQIRCSTLRSLVLIRPINHNTEVSWVRDSLSVLGLSYFLGEEDTISTSSVFTIRDLITKTWYGTNCEDLTTKKRAIAIIRNTDSESLSLLRNILEVASNHTETSHRRLIHLLTCFHTVVIA